MKIDRRHRGLPTIAAGMVVALLLMVMGITTATAEETPASRCDITATRQGAVVTITHLSPLPGPGVVEVNGVTYREWDSAGGVVSMTVTVPANEPAIIQRYLPPPGGECTISLPAERESRWGRWRDRHRWHAERDAWRDR